MRMERKMDTQTERLTKSVYQRDRE